MNNNIFKFATKELTQDAFIAWMINWINDDEASEMKKLAKEFLIEIIDKKSTWKKKIQEGKCKIKIEVQFYNIDVLVLIYDENECLAVIIEDKVATNEHDSQIERYKNVLIPSLKKVAGYKELADKIKEENIVTCYYKIYDECNIEEKPVDKLFTRKSIIKLMEKYPVIHQEYFRQYFEYIKSIEECAQNYEDEDKYDEIIGKKKEDIKYFAYFTELENEFKEYKKKTIKLKNEEEEITVRYCGKKVKSNKKEEDHYELINLNQNVKKEEFMNEKVYYGSDSSNGRKTWWCNIPVKLKIHSDIFNKYAYIKINFYENKVDTIMLKISKKNSWVETLEEYKNIEAKQEDEKSIVFKQEKYYYKENEYYNIYRKYNGIAYDNKEVFDCVLEMLNKQAELLIGDTKLYINKANKASNSKTQPEMNILNIKIPVGDKKDKIDIINKVIKKLRKDLENKELLIEQSGKEMNKLVVKEK